MAELVFNHVDSPHIARVVATGFVVQGPTPDNLVHLLAYRDAFVLRKQTFEFPDDLAEGTEVTLHPKKMEGELLRENVAVISLPLNQLDNLIQALETRRAAIQKKDAALQDANQAAD